MAYIRGGGSGKGAFELVRFGRPGAPSNFSDSFLNSISVNPDFPFGRDYGFSYGTEYGFIKFKTKQNCRIQIKGDYTGSYPYISARIYVDNVYKTQTPYSSSQNFSYDVTANGETTVEIRMYNNALNDGSTFGGVISISKI